MEEKTKVLEQLKRLKNLADLGLFYADNEFDKERYEDILEICYDFQSVLTNQTIDNLKTLFLPVNEYPTAKVDVRGLLLSDDGKILLAKESVDNKWSLPGGWADIGFSAKENIIKEFKEETGLDVEVLRLLAVFDKKMHPHPYQPFYTYKIFFYCKAVSSGLNKGFDIFDVDYFDIDNLPELSEDRILKNQMELLYKKIIDKDFEVLFD